MDMGIDETRDDEFPGQVDNPGPLRQGLCPELEKAGDPPFLQNERPVGQERAGRGVEDRHMLQHQGRRRRLRLRRSRLGQGGDGQADNG